MQKDRPVPRIVSTSNSSETKNGLGTLRRHRHLSGVWQDVLMVLTRFCKIVVLFYVKKAKTARAQSGENTAPVDFSGTPLLNCQHHSYERVTPGGKIAMDRGT